MASPAREILKVLTALAQAGKALLPRASDRRSADDLLKRIRRQPGSKQVVKAMERALGGKASGGLQKVDYPTARPAKQRPAGEDGKLILVNSSNVHSIGYLPEERLMMVRFLGNVNGRRAGPGPLYHYFNVPPKIWQRLRDSASKGGAVWDLLRIRGTAYGHQFDYALVGVVGGYVPRKGTEAGLKPRELLQGGRVFRSSRPGTGRFKGE